MRRSRPSLECRRHPTKTSSEPSVCRFAAGAESGKEEPRAAGLLRADPPTCQANFSGNCFAMASASAAAIIPMCAEAERSAVSAAA